MVLLVGDAIFEWQTLHSIIPACACTFPAKIIIDQLHKINFLFSNRIKESLERLFLAAVIEFETQKEKSYLSIITGRERREWQQILREIEALDQILIRQKGNLKIKICMERKSWNLKGEM